jgi:protein-disulfide isomerase
MGSLRPAGARAARVRRWIRVATRVAVAGTMLGVATPASAADGPAGEVAARVGDQVITVAELERLAGAEMQRLLNERYALLSRTLDEAITRRLLELAARAEGITADELLEREVGRKLAPVTEADVDAFYAANQDQIGESRDRAAGEIRQFLADRDREEATRRFVARLGERYPVSRRLDPPRVAVAAEGFATRGPADAPVTIVEFSDFECPYCRRMVEPLRQLQARHPRELRLVYRHFPLQQAHPNAQLAAEASECARDQGRFWEAHDALFASRERLQPAAVRQLGRDLRLDARRFEQCLDSGRHARRVLDDLAAGEAAGVSGTPAFFINGRFVNGAVSVDALAAIVADELARAPGVASGAGARNETATTAPVTSPVR